MSGTLLDTNTAGTACMCCLSDCQGLYSPVKQAQAANRATQKCA